MRTAAGIFASRKEAELVLEKLKDSGFEEKNILMLLPGRPPKQLETVPTEEAEQPGMGKAIGSVVGGAVGLAAGAMLGSLFLPGVGPVLIAGGVGLGGALAGGAGGDALENLLARGLPKDELFLYEDALRKGRSVVIALSSDDEKLESARRIMAVTGAESIDAAREQWWIGLRDAEAAQYDAAGEGAFSRDEAIYRTGFEAALNPEFRGTSFSAAQTHLRERFPTAWNQEAFRRGYLRGQNYASNLNFEDHSKSSGHRRALKT